MNIEVLKIRKKPSRSVEGSTANLCLTRKLKGIDSGSVHWLNPRRLKFSLALGTEPNENRINNRNDVENWKREITKERK